MLPRRRPAPPDAGGSRIDIIGDLSLDRPLDRISTMTAAVPKLECSGRMVFVTLRHEVGCAGKAPAIVEEQDIVYREAARSTVDAASGSVAADGPEDVPQFVNAYRIHTIAAI